jgi:hypothetical protein
MPALECRQAEVNLCCELPTDALTPPWINHSSGLITWWNMEIFAAADFYKIARFLERVDQPGFTVSVLKRIGEVDLAGSCRKLGLTLSVAHIKRIRERFEELDKNPTPQVPGGESQGRMAEAKELFRALQERIQDEMAERLFLFVPSDDAMLFQSSDSFLGEGIIKKWPQLVEDSSEAAKCFALSRYTAAVFHFMRVMEFGVQKLGDKLGVSLTQELNWQRILDQVDKAIKALDQKGEETKKLASVSANLYNVKLAWRNEVMHPKATYTREEAKRVLDSVQSFLAELAGIT